MEENDLIKLDLVDVIKWNLASLDLIRQYLHIKPQPNSFVISSYQHASFFFLCKV